MPQLASFAGKMNVNERKRDDNFARDFGVSTSEAKRPTPHMASPSMLIVMLRIHSDLFGMKISILGIPGS